MKSILLTTIALALLMLNVSALTIISKEESWKYLDNGITPDITWIDDAFNDDTWVSSDAPLGYGNPVTTTISYGDDVNNKHITYYFRKTFNIDDNSANDSYIIKIMRDDGAVVYVNGQEVLRSNMPTGEINSQTLATSAVTDTDESKYFQYSVSSSFFKDDSNNIAVEIHQRTLGSSDLSFDMEMTTSATSKFRKSPYLLYPGENDEMLILWQLDITATSTIKWGVDENQLNDSVVTTEFGSDHQHKILLNGLNSNTHYYYDVTINNNTSKTGSFSTGALDNANKISFYAYGDHRNFPVNHDMVAAQMLNSIAQDSISQTIIVTTGDYVDEGDNESAWDIQFFNKSYPNIQKLLANLPYLTAMGNHEGQGLLFTKYFPYPMFEDSMYYSFDYGPAHFIIVDQFTDYSVGSTQHNWLVNDLASSDKEWKILLLHEPGWSARYHVNNKDVQRIIQPLCVEYGVQFVITGHNHYYARAVVDDVYHITSGGGGAPLNDPKPDSEKVVFFEKTYHFCKLDIAYDTLHFAAIRADGSEIESFNYIIKRPVTGIDPILQIKSEFKVYAKSNSIIIENNSIEKATIMVFDVWGREIIQQKLTDKELNIHVQQSGVYFVRVIVKGQFFVKKVVVK